MTTVMAYLRPSLGVRFVLLVLLVASCGGGGGTAERTASVSISSPADGATVATTFPVTMQAEGLTIQPAGDVADGAGHYHLIVNAACLSAGETVPDDPDHVHLSDGASETELTLPPGEHTLCLQAGDGQHAALDLTHEITITVAPDGGGTATTTQAESLVPQEWEGTYDGEVVWDCGAAGTHTGTLEADVQILVGADGSATMEADHTVTGSCADTGSLTTPLTVEGERTSSGFTFPSTTWGVPGSFTLEADGDTASGTLSGALPGPATMTIVFDLECTDGC